VQARLEKEGVGLMENGSSYSNIFTGGAAEAHFCISDIGFSKVFKRWQTLSFVVVVFFHVLSLLRAAVLLVFETVLAVVDFFRGFFGGCNLWKELKFVPSRVAMCILLREIIVIGAKMDIIRGLPIIHINFMGFHEQSHRRGATSQFAHWTLKGIDNAIKRIALCSNRAHKEYELWIYSDHGQVDTIPYSRLNGESLSRTVKTTLGNDEIQNKIQGRPKGPGFLNRLGLRINKYLKSLSAGHGDSDKIIVTDLGPYAQVYLDEQNRKDIRGAAEKLIATGSIPMILYPEQDKIAVLTRQGRYLLPEETAFFEDQYLPAEMIDDLMYACRHKDAGDLMICGYRSPHKPFITFAMENGSHGGLSEHEYCGFFAGPADCPVDVKKGYVRPEDIRNGVLRILKRKLPSKTLPNHSPRQDSFRLMTYNVHSCVGMDGKLSPLRIAKVIEQFSPDIVALQELDIFKQRSLHEDQAKIIADILEMDHFFSPAVMLEDEKYGDAILSRFPMRLVKNDILPGLKEGSRREPRGALWVEISIGVKKVQVVNTHLGLTFAERKKQIEALLSEKWLGSDESGGYSIFCGDLNFGRRSKLYRLCTERFNEINIEAGPQGTYCGRYPFIRIDHIFHGKNLEATDCFIGDTDQARMASDHRPLIAAFKMI
jgi:endonuclease/exonuclease/phosphatase family metal-dependent hydrolase